MPAQLPAGWDYALILGCGIGIGYAACVLLDRLGQGARWW
jgi:hypothetical protein